MKKIFTLLTAILLSASMGWALEWSWSSSEFVTATKIGDDGANTVYRYEWWRGGSAKNYPCTRIVVCYVSANGVTYGGNKYPPKGNYYVSWEEGAGRIACYQTTNDYYWVYSNSRWNSMLYNSSGTQMKYYSGDFVFDEGDGGICVTSTNLVLANSAYSALINNGTTNSVTCGTPATYYTPTIQANNDSYGDVSSAYKSGYIYANNRSREFKKNSVYTLTATKKSGYRFVCWKKNGTQITTDKTTDVTITGNDTYTAVFEPDGNSFAISTAVSPAGYGTVSGAGSYAENNNVNLTATPASLDYYFSHWLKGGSSFAGNTANPLTSQTVTAAATYTAVFATRDVVNITASSDMEMARTGSYWSVAGEGTDASSNSYTMNIRFDASSMTGNFNSGVNTANTWVQKAGSSKVYAQSISVATVTEPTTGRLHIVATIIGSDEKKYVITGDYDKPIVGSWGTFSWDDPNQHISINTTQSTGTQCEAQWSPTVNNFMYIQAYDDTYSTDNYVIIYLATSQSSSYKGYDNANISGPKKDQTYIFEQSSEVVVQAPCKADMWSSNINFYRWEYLSERAVPYMYDSWCGWDGFNDIGCLGRCAQSSVVASKPAGDNNLTVNTTTRVILDDYYVTTTEGKDGKPFIRLYDNSDNLLIVIGAPAPPVNNHTVTITAPTNGTITVLDGETQISDGGEVEDGTTLTISAAGNTGYHLSALTVNGNAFTSGNTYDLDDDITIAATFAANTYTVTFDKNGGTGDDMTAQDFTYGTAQNLTVNAYTAPENKHFMGWATTAEGDVAYADGAEVSNLTATQNGEVELFAKWAYNTYTVVFNKNNEDATGIMANQAFTYGTAQNLTTNSFTLSGHDFAGWATEENGAVVYTNGEEVNNLTSVHEGTVNLYAKWIEVFALIDSYNAGNNYYETLADKAGQTMNVRYERTFPAGEWAAFSLPFGYSFQKEGNNTFRDQVYYLISAEYEVEGGKAYLTLNCMPNTLGIVANKPYVLIPNETIENPVFNNVKMKAQAFNYYSVPCTNIGVADPVETVEFRNTLTRMQFANNDHRQIYLVGSKLRYPNNGTSIRAFRGYFYMQEGTIQHIQPRLRNAETGEIIEAEEETNTTVETKKYIENGILVIERAGMKYDAQGHIIK